MYLDLSPDMELLNNACTFVCLASGVPPKCKGAAGYNKAPSLHLAACSIAGQLHHTAVCLPTCLQGLDAESGRSLKVRILYINTNRESQPTHTSAA
jgi:hypothetical protein